MYIMQLLNSLQREAPATGCREGKLTRDGFSVGINGTLTLRGCGKQPGRPEAGRRNDGGHAGRWQEVGRNNRAIRFGKYEKGKF